MTYLLVLSNLLVFFVFSQPLRQLKLAGTNLLELSHSRPVLFSTLIAFVKGAVSCLESIEQRLHEVGSRGRQQTCPLTNGNMKSAVEELLLYVGEPG